MALNELKTSIAEKYLENMANGIYSRVKAVEEIHPIIKNKYSYAYKLWRDTEFRLYLSERTKEVVAETHGFHEMAKASIDRTKENLGLEKSKVWNFDKDGCYSEQEGYYSNSKEVQGFLKAFSYLTNITTDVEELKKIMEEEANTRKNKELSHKKSYDKQRLAIENKKINGNDNRNIKAPIINIVGKKNE